MKEKGLASISTKLKNENRVLVPRFLVPKPTRRKRQRLYVL